MKKLLLSACLAAACWTSDVGAMGEHYDRYLSNENGSVYSGKILDVSSWGNRELLSQYKEFPNVEVLKADLNIFRVTYRTTLGRVFQGEQFKLDLNKFPKIKKLVLGNNRKECSIIEGNLDLYAVEGFITRTTGIPMLDGIENLEELDMSNLSIVEIPDSIQKFRGLKKLYLGDNFLEKLPRSIGNLTNLETLILGSDAKEHSNCLVTLPDTIGNLVNLKELCLFGCGLRELPATIGNLRNLELLSLGFNKLLELPESIGNLRKLKTLSLSWHPNVSIDSIHRWELETGDSFLSNYRNQRFIEVKIPVTIGNLVNLQVLNLSHNLGLKTLPDSIGNLVNLQSLDLSDNRELKTLPNSIGNLTNLEYFSVDDHVALPPTVRNLKKLSSRKLEKLEEQIND